MYKWQKKRKDRQALAGYEKRLRAERKHYRQKFEAISETGRKNRALAIGECCLQAFEKLNDLVNQRPAIPFVEGSLYFNLGEQRVKDEDGEKGFRYSVTYNLQSYEPAWDEKQIAEKVVEAQRRLAAETEEMYSEEEEDGGQNT